ncbi:MAG: hypothetical protein AAB536_03620 [Patescibacteria group bacterium]
MKEGRSAVAVLKLMNRWKSGITQKIINERYPLFGNLNGVRRMVRLLQKDDEEAWARFLFALSDTRFDEFKPLSPFADKIVVSVSYGNGYSSFGGDTVHVAEDSDRASNLVKLAIRSRGWAVHDNDDYVLVFDRFGEAKADVFWIGCKTSGIDSPETEKRAIEIEKEKPDYEKAANRWALQL